jgi:hypothetical protein
METTKKRKNRGTEKNDQRIKTNFEMMKLLLPMYRDRLNQPEQLRVFYEQFRNSIFDTTNTKEFKIGFISLEARTALENGAIRTNFTSDHVIRRVHGVAYLFHVLNSNPNMGYRTFKKHLKEVGQQVFLTHREHQLVNQFTRRTDKNNVEAYNELGIEVVGYHKKGRPKVWNRHVQNKIMNIYRRLGI